MTARDKEDLGGYELELGCGRRVEASRWGQMTWKDSSEERVREE